MQAEVWEDLAHRFGDLAGPAAALDPKADLYAYRRADSDTAELQQLEAGSSRTIPDLTPASSREERLQEFIAAHPGATLADVRHSADLHKPEFQDWRNGKLGDTSVMSQRIENVLADG